MARVSDPDIAYMFDLGGVIVGHDNAALYHRIASRCTSETANATIPLAASDPAYGTGTRPITDLHAQLVQEAGYNGDWACFVADWSSHFTVDASMLAFVETLAARRRVLLFSNTNDAHWTYLVAATDGRLGRLEAYLSHELGMLKPDPNAFTTVARRAGLTPARTLFIDDVAANVDGARRAGFLGLHFINEAALRRDLAA